MDASNTVGRRRINSRVNAEDQALNQIAKEVRNVQYSDLYMELCTYHIEI